MPLISCHKAKKRAVVYREKADDAKFVQTLLGRAVCLFTDWSLPQVADDKIADFHIVNPQNDVIYHLYDEGADVILVDTADVEVKKRQYANWLSKHRAGL